MLVLVGVLGEGVELALKIWREELYKKHERKIDVVGFIFWAIVVIGLAWEIPDASKSDKEADEAKTQLAILNNKTLELAYQYDLSTNALAEAQARLASIRPLKERLVEWFNSFNPSALQMLKAGQTPVKINLYEIPEISYFQLVFMLREPGAGAFCELVGQASEALNGGPPGNIVTATAVLKPALVQ